MVQQTNIFEEVNQKVKNILSNYKIDKENLDKENPDKELVRGLITLDKSLPNISKAYNSLIKDNDTLKIGIIGQVKAGKSSFLNALFLEGKDILPKAATPMTAGLTVIGYGPKYKFKVEYYSKQDWDTLLFKAKEYDSILQEVKQNDPSLQGVELKEKVSSNADETISSAKELVDNCSLEAKNRIGQGAFEKEFNSIDALLGELNDYVGANGKFTSVTKTLFLYLPEESLKGIEIVDTPGINDPVVSREERTNEFLRSCHGVFLLSYAGQFCSNTDMTFLKERVFDQGISSAVILASKFDSGLIDIARDCGGDIQYAISRLNDSLKEGLEEAYFKKGFNQTMPEMTYVSGLCHSLAIKDSKQWDSTEVHVEGLLRKNFPLFNSLTPDQAKDFLKLLGNVVEIQEKFIDGNFKENKDRIIQEKVSRFVNKNKENVQLELTNTLELFNDKKRTLKSISDVGIENVKLSKNEINSFKKESESIISSLISDINNLPKKLMKEVSLNIIPKSEYVVEKEFVVKCKKGIFGILSKNVSVSAKVVDSGKLREALRNYYSSIIFDIDKKIMLELSQEGPSLQSFRSKVEDILKKQNVDGLKVTVFMDAMKKCLNDSYEKRYTFKSDDIIDSILKRIDEKISPSSRTGLSTSFKDSDGMTVINKEYEDHFFNEIKEYDEKISELGGFTRDCMLEDINQIKHSMGSILRELGNKFGEEINRIYSKVVAQYEKELASEKETLLLLDETSYLLVQAIESIQ